MRGSRRWNVTHQAAVDVPKVHDLGCDCLAGALAMLLMFCYTFLQGNKFTSTTLCLKVLVSSASYQLTDRGAHHAGSCAMLCRPGRTNSQSQLGECAFKGCQAAAANMCWKPACPGGSIRGPRARPARLVRDNCVRSPRPIYQPRRQGSSASRARHWLAMWQLHDTSRTLCIHRALLPFAKRLALMHVSIQMSREIK